MNEGTEMAKDFSDGIKLSQPRPYLTRMMLFLALVGFLLLILAPRIMDAFLANPGLNGLIVGTLFIGMLYAFRQVLQLGPEVKWVNAFRRADPGLALPPAPQLLAPMATMLGNRKGRMTLSAGSMRAMLDSIGSRLDEQREISRYMIGLLIFLGLLGTFWGLLITVSSVGDTLQSLNVEATDSASVFTSLREGLQAPLRGMGTAFSSSLFGLTGSLILGFLDLQAGQAQNRFYNELEEWLSTVTNVIDVPASAGENTTPEQASLLALAGQIAALTEQLHAEQRLVRELAENQAAIRPALEELAGSLKKRGS